jgi:6,7-dimethyl-8-ribityllumazine synthase
MLEDKLHLLIVEERLYPDISDALLKGASDAITLAGAGFEVVTVPSVFEIPAAIALAEESGHRPAGVRYDGYVALGCLIRGETYHFEVVANESARGLTDLAIGKRLAIGNGVLTVESEQQARVRAQPVADGNDEGAFAARACLTMVALKYRLIGRAR